VSREPIIRAGFVAIVVSVALSVSGALAAPPVYRIDHVTDGDTVVLRNGQRVRLVQIDTPEVFFGRECYGRAASFRTKTLLPRGTRVRLLPEPATDRVDQYGRLLRYVVRVRDGVNVNIRLVAVGCRGALLLPAPQRALRQASKRARPPCKGKEARPLAGMSAHALQPVQGARNT
jgi:endonuclease YncB( thermonuclease family)